MRLHPIVLACLLAAVVVSGLQVAPVGFASRWNPGGPPSGMVGGAGVGVWVSAMAVTEGVARDSAGPREIMLARAAPALAARAGLTPARRV